ncbi:MAG: peptidoglycan editing factor PgeF [Ignavibacteria bacterium]
MIITSKILSSQNNIIHGVSTKAGGTPPYYNNLSKHVGDSIDDVMQNRARFFGLLGIAETTLVHGNQVHSDGIAVVTKPGLYSETDALITSQTGLNLVISVADCMPVMILDPVKNIIANIHSGWRGTQKNVAVKTIDVMKKEFGCKTRDMLVFMGPAISKKNFEVDKDVAEMFPPQYVSVKPDSPCKFNVDTGQMVYDNLIASGILHDNIERSPLCTYDETESLHSYRRDKSASGRMFAVIGMK